MRMFAGIDGCRSGWLVIVLGGREFWRWRLCADFAGAAGLASGTVLTLADVPIGLKDEGPEERSCDREARRLLGRPRMSAVYRIPPRPVVYSKSYGEACSMSEAMTGGKISVQTWNILPKIREADSVFGRNPRLQRRIRETHPELCFLGFTGHPMSHSKKSAEGVEERLCALQKVCPPAEEIFTSVVNSVPRLKALADDILDALAAACSARLAVEHARILGTGERDSRGLRMEIVYGACRTAELRDGRKM